MRSLKAVVFVGVLFVLVHSLKAQNLVNVSVALPQYNQIYVADLDIEHAKSAGLLFTATLQSTANVPVSVRLRLTVNLYLAGQPPFAPFLTAQSNPFTMQPKETKIITNVDLSSSNSSISLDRSTYNYNQDEFDQIKNVALATGKAPAGIYEFILECVDANNNNALGTDKGQITVTNPSRVDLVLPIDGGSVTTLYPHFQWSANADTVTLFVYEKLPNQQSPQDVVSGVPYLQQTVGGSSLNYPPSGPGVRLLENGKTYYWFVQIPASATRGNGVRSDIWSFTIAGLDTSGGSSVDNVAATKALVNFLTGTQYQSLLSQVTTLNGTVLYDGSSLSMQDLIDVLQNMDKSKITSVTIQ